MKLRISLIFFSTLLYFYSSLVLADCSSLNPSSVNKEIVVKLSALSRKNITRAKLKDGSHIKPESQEEKSLPIVTKEWENCAVAAGFASASAELCGLNYSEKIFKPFMEMFKQKSNPSDKQSAYVGLLHGVALGIGSEQFKSSKSTCSPKIRTSLERLIVK